MTDLTFVTVDAADVAEGIDGPAWVKLKTRVKGKYRSEMLEYQSILMEVNALEVDEKNAQVAVELSRKMVHYDQNIMPGVIAALTVDWNWLDDETGAALESPSPDVIRDELDQDQIAWLTGQVFGLLNKRSVVGNPTTGGD